MPRQCGFSGVENADHLVAWLSKLGGVIESCCVKHLFVEDHRACYDARPCVALLGKEIR